jgi:hypothetical protein
VSNLVQNISVIFGCRVSYVLIYFVIIYRYQTPKMNGKRLKNDSTLDGIFQVVCAIDGKHVNIQAPPKSGLDVYNSKGALALFYWQLLITTIVSNT